MDSAHNDPFVLTTLLRDPPERLPDDIAQSTASPVVQATRTSKQSDATQRAARSSEHNHPVQGMTGAFYNHEY